MYRGFRTTGRCIYKVMLRSFSCFPVNCDHLDEQLNDVRSELRDNEEEIRMWPAHAQPDYPWVLTMAR